MKKVLNKLVGLYFEVNIKEVLNRLDGLYHEVI